MLNKEKIFILGGPAGTGKTTLVNMLVKEFPDLSESISYTTRPPRSNEQDGVDYHFISREKFDKMINAGEILEYVELYGFYYGTSRSFVESQIKQNQNVILIIDAVGAANVAQFFETVTICLHPPSLAELRFRLQRRRADSPEEIQKRMDYAVNELEGAKEYDYHVMNDDLESAYRRLKEILVLEGVVS